MMVGRVDLDADTHAKLKSLSQEHAVLGQEVSAFVHCLESAGIVSRDHLQAQVHRTSFEAARRSSHWCPAFEIEDVLPMNPLASGLLSYSDAAEVQTLRATSANVQASIDEIGMKLYVVGGLGATESSIDMLNSVDRYDLVRNAWEELGEMRMGFRRSNHTGATAYGGQLFVCGGNPDVLSRSLMRFDFDGRGRWQLLPSMIQSRLNFSLVVNAGVLIAAGGWDHKFNSLATVESFNPKRDHEPSWQLLPSMSTSRWIHAAASVSGQVFVCGGEVSQGGQLQSFLSSTERFEPESNTWHFAPPMPMALSQARAVHIWEKIYVAGGSHRGVVSNVLFCFDPAHETWTSLAPMHDARAAHAAAVVSGKLYVCGGYDRGPAFGTLPTSDSCLASVEVFDPRVGVWNMLPPMPIPRILFSCHASTRERIIL